MSYLKTKTIEILYFSFPKKNFIITCNDWKWKVLFILRGFTIIVSLLLIFCWVFNRYLLHICYMKHIISFSAFFSFQYSLIKPQKWDIADYSISSYSLTFVVFGIRKLLISARYHTWFNRFVILLKILYKFSHFPRRIISYALCVRVYYLEISSLILK